MWIFDLTSGTISGYVRNKSHDIIISISVRHELWQVCKTAESWALSKKNFLPNIIT